MALPAVTGLIRVLLQYTLPGVSILLNRLFFQGTGSTTNTALNTWCGNIASSWNTNMSPNSVPDLALIGVTAEDLTSSTSPVGAAAVNHPGTNTNPQSAPAIAFVVRNGTNLRERGGHSRTYVPGIPTGEETTASANTWNSTFASALLTSWKAFIAAVTGVSGPAGYSGTAQVMPNYYHGFTSVQNPITKRYRNIPTPLATPVIYPITNQTYNSILASQRRRNKQTGG